MLVTHRPAAAPLAPHVDTIWFMSRGALPHSRELCLPTGCADIVIPLLQDSVVRFDTVASEHARHFRGAVACGVHDRFAVRGMGGASSALGVHFRPGGAALSELNNRTELLDSRWGSAARELRERLRSAEPADPCADRRRSRYRVGPEKSPIRTARRRLSWSH